MGLTVWLGLRALEGGFRAEARMATNITVPSLFLGALAIGAAVWWSGSVIFALVLVLGIALHEYGHVTAFRAMGHTDAQFRLVPLLGGVAISRFLPRSQLSDFYITFMGPGIMLMPLVVAGVALDFVDGTMRDFFGYVFLITGAINFFNLLPLWPLDGGRMTRGILYAFSPKLAGAVTVAMSLGLIAFCFVKGYYIIMIVAFMGLRPAIEAGKISSRQPPMTRSQALVGLGAYLAAITAHGMAGWYMIRGFLL